MVAAFEKGLRQFVLDAWMEMTANLEFARNTWKRACTAGLLRLFLAVSLPQRNQFAHWKEIVELTRRLFTHHLELHSGSEIDDVVVRYWVPAGDRGIEIAFLAEET